MSSSSLNRFGVLVLSAAMLAGGLSLIMGPSVTSHAATVTPTFVTKSNSTNWAGYVATSSSKFTEVTGEWKEPAVVGSCPTSARYAAFWIGIDGYTSTSVEQIGSDADCSGGAATYYAWYEMYPAASVTIGSLTVSPGDVLSASVKVVGTTFTLSLNDVTAGTTFSIHKTASHVKQSSAEWIVESPEICGATCTLAKLNDFGTAGFSHCQAATGGSLQAISSFTAGSGPHQLTMINSAGTKVRALPSALGTTGLTFTVRWKSA